jgi:hypothetical protein
MTLLNYLCIYMGFAFELMKYIRKSFCMSTILSPFSLNLDPFFTVGILYKFQMSVRYMQLTDMTF